MNQQLDPDQIPSAAPLTPVRPVRQWISTQTLVFFGLGAISVVMAIIMLLLPDMLQPALIAIPPAIILGYLILKNPYVGVYSFFFYNFLRPYEFIRVLIPLRITLVIEVVTLLAWIISLVVNKQRIKWTTFHTLFAFFLCVIGVTVVTAANNFLALQSFQAMAVLFIMFVIAADVVNTPKRLKYIIWMMILVHSYFALKGISTFLSGSYTGYKGNSSGVVGGSFWSDENDFALAINVMVPYCIFGFLYLKKYARLIAGAILIIFVMAVIASVSRGGLVGLMAIFAFVVMISKRKFMTIGIALVVGVTMLAFAPSSYWKVAETTTETGEGTANERILYWQAGLRMGLAYPIVGVGAGNGGVHMPFFYDGPRQKNTQYGRTFHGTWPQIIAETGLLGSIPYFLMIIFAFRYLFRLKKGTENDDDPTLKFVANSLIGSIIGYVGSATFLSTAYYPELWTAYTFMMIVVFCHERTGASVLKPVPEPKPGRPVTAPPKGLHA